MSTLPNNNASDSTTKPAKSGRRVRRFTADMSAIAEPALWGFGGALAIGVILIVGFLFLIGWNGATTFWPKPIAQVTLLNGDVIAGEPTRGGEYRVGEDILAALTPEQQATIKSNEGFASRTLYKTANFDLNGDDFRWVSDYEVKSTSYPKDYFLIERQQWGTFIGRIESLIIDGKPDPFNAELMHKEQEIARDRFHEMRDIERNQIGEVNHYMDKERLDIRKAVLKFGADSPQALAEVAEADAKIKEYEAEFAKLQDQVGGIRDFDKKYQAVLKEVGGKTLNLPLSEVVRFYAANDLSFFQKIKIYISRWVEFVSTEPREANTQGGVLPAIFGTVTMTMIMVIVVAPSG